MYEKGSEIKNVFPVIISNTKRWVTIEVVTIEASMKTQINWSEVFVSRHNFEGQRLFMLFLPPTVAVTSLSRPSSCPWLPPPHATPPPSQTFSPFHLRSSPTSPPLFSLSSRSLAPALFVVKAPARSLSHRRAFLTNTQTPFRITNLRSAIDALLTHEGCSLFAASACFLLGFSVLPRLFVTCQFSCLILASWREACIAFLFSSLGGFAFFFVQSPPPLEPRKQQRIAAALFPAVTGRQRLTFCALNRFSAHINFKVLHYAPFIAKNKAVLFLWGPREADFQLERKEKNVPLKNQRENTHCWNTRHYCGKLHKKNPLKLWLELLAWAALIIL